MSPPSAAKSQPRTINFAVVGCGLMGREFASAVGRWCNLGDVDFEPRILAVCGPHPGPRQWFERHVPSLLVSTDDYKALLKRDDIDAVYCAVPHHLHADIYCDIINAGKHLLGEKPFGIDLPANQRINQAIAANPDVLVRCCSQMPFFPGAYRITQWAAQGRFGRIIDVEAGFLHSSDLNPDKPINWKRRIATNGEYGCLGDLGMHVAHLPLRFGWKPATVFAVLTNIITTRPDGKGSTAACETWDNATLACIVDHEQGAFPMLLHTKRIAPGHANTWFIRVHGTRFSAAYSTKQPKQLAILPYEPGASQAWHVQDVPHSSAYPVITGSIFEFGFSDAILQMWAAFCDELVHGKDMAQPFNCATPAEAAQSHRLFTACLESQRHRQSIALDWSTTTLTTTPVATTTAAAPTTATTAPPQPLPRSIVSQPRDPPSRWL